jgi:hypothetical protein
MLKARIGMTVDRRDDLAFSILLITPVLLYASICANPLYTGSGYLVAVPAAVCVLGLMFRKPALLLTGTTAGAVATLLIYMNIIASLDHPEGLFGLGHVF